MTNPGFPLGDGIRAPRTRLFGHAAELGQLEAWAASGERLVTLTGGGGIGKTRLATELALRLRQRGPVLFIESGAAATAAEALTTLGRSLGADLSGKRDDAAIAGALGSTLALRGNLVVVLDEIDRIVAPLGPLLDRILDLAPESRFVVTSRERLGVAGERVVIVHPLPGDDPQGPAVALFLDRAERAGARPDYDRHERAALDALVRRLDGLPLAIEIAAARADVLAPSRLLELLSHRFEVLATTTRGREGRHTSMHAAVAFSWELLPPEARAALARLSVLTGAFDLAAARAVMGTTPRDALVLVETLARRSLLVMRGGSEGLLLETVRDFARDAAASLGVLSDAVNRRDAHYVERAERLERASRGWGGATAMAELAAIREQLQAIVGEALDGRSASPEAALRVALTLATFIRRAGLPPWGLRELPALCRMARDVDFAVTVRALIFTARLETDGGKAEALTTLARARAAIPPDAPDAARWLADILVHEGRDAFDHSRFDAAAQKDEEAMRLAAACGPAAAEVEAMALTNRTMARIRSATPRSALDHGARSRALPRGRRARPPAHPHGHHLLRGEPARPGRARPRRPARGPAHRARRRHAARRDRARRLPRPVRARRRRAGVGARAPVGLVRARQDRLRAPGRPVRGDDDAGRARARRPRRRGRVARRRAHPAHALRRDRRAGLRRVAGGARRALAGDLSGARAQLERLDPAILAEENGVSIAGDGLCAIVHIADALARADRRHGRRRACRARAEPLRARLVAAASRGDDVRRALSLVDRAVAAATGQGTVLCMSLDGLALRTVGPDGASPWEDLSRKPTLARILLALVRARLDRPGTTLSAAALGEAGWPGERMLEDARDNRLYVTLTKLRQARLETALEHLPGGWRLRPDLGVLWLEPRVWVAPPPPTAPAPPAAAKKAATRPATRAPTTPPGSAPTGGTPRPPSGRAKRPTPRT
ncbi:MAG: AAA family ATPase [Myxococcota bacterium]